MIKMMILALAFVGSAAEAQRSSTLDMTCHEARDLVRSHGAVLLSTGEYTYDRYVAHGGYCSRQEETRPAWVPTMDRAQCFIGYTCEMWSGD